MLENRQDAHKTANNKFVQQCRTVSEIDVTLAALKHIRYTCDDAKKPPDNEAPITPPVSLTSGLMEFNNFIELMEFLNQQDLLRYLPVPIEAKKGKAFCCIFHDDITSSAVVDCKNDKWKFFCNDTNCDYHQPAGLDIIDITQKMYNMRWSEAVDFLGHLYDFTFKATTDFSRSQTIKLTTNKAFLLNNLVKYPNLNQILHGYIEVLLKLMNIASTNIYEDLINVCTDESIFFMSCRYLSEKVDFNYLDVNRILNLYANLGLIDKIPFKLVPKKYSEKSERLATEGQSEGKSMPRIQYFTINSFEVVAGEAERRASILLTKNFVLSDVSKMYFDRFLGKDITQFTYPDYRYQIELKMTEQTRLVKIVILKNIKLYGFCGFDELRKEKQLSLVSKNKLKDSMKNLILVLELQNIKWMKMNKALCSKFGYDKFNYVFCDINHEEVDILSCNMEDEDDIQVYNIEHSDALEEFDDPVPF